MTEVDVTDLLATATDEEVTEAEIVEEDGEYDGLFKSTVLPVVLNRTSAELAVLDAAGMGDAKRARQLAEFARKSSAVRASHIAKSTRTAYDYDWRMFVAWCRSFDLSPMPADPEIVTWYLASQINLDRPKESIRPTTIGRRLAAINKAHRICRQPTPGDHPIVEEFMAGAVNALGAFKEKVAPLVLRELEQVIEHIMTPGLRQTRDATLVSIAHATGWGASALARLEWETLTLEGASVELPLTSGARGLQVVGSIILGSRVPRELCPVEALGTLRTHIRTPRGPVFTRIDDAGLPMGEPMSTQAITQLLRRHAADAGVTLPRAGLPTWTDARAQAAVAAIGRPRLIDVRDVCILTLGWAAALRRSNLHWLWWREVPRVEQGIEVFLRRSKTDQAQEGSTIGVPFAKRHPKVCAVTWLEEWKRRVTAELGRAPLPMEPLFFPIDRHGNLILDEGDAGLDVDDISEMVKRRCASAGLDGRYSGHSMRRGFATTAAVDGRLSAEQIARQTLHKRLDNVREYVDRAEIFRDNPVEAAGY